jgi:hypothetical protein
MLRGLSWKIFIKVSGQIIGPIFMGQDVDCLTLEGEIKDLSRNVGNQLPICAA